MKNNRKNQKKNSSDTSPLSEFLVDNFSPDAIKQKLRAGAVNFASFIKDCGLGLFYARERIFCGAVTALLSVFFVMLQTTVFSFIRPFGAVPDFMLSFVIALSVTEGRKRGAIWGIVCALTVEAVGTSGSSALPLLYMLCGYIAGGLCEEGLSRTFAVRILLSVCSVLPRAIFSTVYALTFVYGVTFTEIMTDIVLPEAAATLTAALPVHFITWLCLRKFHHTRAEMVDRDFR